MLLSFSGSNGGPGRAPRPPDHDEQRVIYRTEVLDANGERQGMEKEWSLLRKATDPRVYPINNLLLDGVPADSASKVGKWMYTYLRANLAFHAVLPIEGDDVLKD